MRGRTLGIVISAVVSLGGSSASAGVSGTVWIEVDNSVGTIGETTDEPTGLESVRTFDLFLIATPDTEILVADFGFAATSGPGRSMWTTQQVYQNELGGDTRSALVGALRTMDVAALEFDTYVGLGRIGTRIVTNTSILRGDWSPSGFVIAWFGLIPPSGNVLSAQVDESGRIFLARISVESEREFGDYSGENEYLGGMIFISGRDSMYTFGSVNGGAGLIPTQNAFDGPMPLFFEDLHDSEVGDQSRSSGDLNFDFVVDAQDLQILLGAVGTLNPFYDLTGDGLVEDRDVQFMMLLVNGSVDEGYSVPSTRKEIKKAERRYRKTLKKAIKKAAKAKKKFKRELRKAVKAMKKERKRLERERRKREKEAEKNNG